MRNNQKLTFKVPTPVIGVEHPTFGYSPPPLPDLLDTCQLQMARHLEVSLQKRQSKSLAFHVDRLPTLQAKYQKLAPFAPFMVESDFAEMLTMCDIGERAPTHSQADEGKPVGSTFEIKFDESVVAEILRDWAPHVRRAMSLPVSVKVPANTNLGWPYLIQDTQDKVRAFVLACIAASVERAKLDGLSLRDVHLMQESVYGPRFLTPSTRTQHSSKQLPLLCSDGVSTIFKWTQNYEGRVRFVAMGGKAAMLFNKAPAKTIINAALSTQQHGQDRKTLFTDIKAWIKRPGWKTIALDVSGFDGGIGGKNLSVILSWIAKLIPDTNHDDLVEESRCQMLVPFIGRYYRTTTSIAPQLPSGVSYTTACALLMGDYIALKFAKAAGLVNGTTFKYKNWGDDFILHFPATVDVKAVMAALKENTNLSFDEESTIKYLGFNYGDGVYETRDGYSVGRLMLKTLLPERKSAYPFGLIGYAARLHFIPGDKEKFHYLATQHLWDPVVLGPPFSFHELNSRLDQALVDASKVKLVDTDVLNFLTHGVEDDALADVFERDLGIDFDFQKWIGNTFIDLTDPERAMRTTAPDVFARHRQLARQAVAGGFSVLPSLMEELQGHYHWRSIGISGPLK